jgi:very-short-patch-repair endonuclease
MRHQPPGLHRQCAKQMRLDATRAEAKLWDALRGRQLEGFKFRRQAPLKGYILDFV